MELALVVQRYGEEVIGGAELLARKLAQHLAAHHRVEVLTTCAKDHFSWANHFPKGVSDEEQITIRRFSVARERNWRQFGHWSRLIFALQRRITLPAWLEERWIISQGPFAPDLVDYIDANTDRFDVFLFITYLYYPTVFGIRRSADKAVLIPTAHDEPAIRMRVFKDLFRLPRYLIFMTDEEKRLVRRLFPTTEARQRTLGMGIAVKQPSEEDDGYLLYAGRVESGKNCEMMFDYCRRAKVPLKVIGPAGIEIPGHVDYLGLVSEEEKERLLARCKAVIVPSTMESLSIAALEAWAHGKPVLAWEKSTVLAAQIQRSQAGYCYGDFESFQRITRDIDPGRGLRGWEFVKNNYSWDQILNGYEEVLKEVHRLNSLAEH